METYQEREEAFSWASSLDLRTLHWMLTVITSDFDAWNPVDTKAILEVVTLRLGRELRGETV